MGVFLALTGWWMYIDVPETPKAVVTCVIIYNAAFGYRYDIYPQLCSATDEDVSWGPLPWLYPPEVIFKWEDDWTVTDIYIKQIMPLSVRAKGVSLSTATNWAFNFLVGEMTPILQEVIEWRLYPMHGFFCACSFVVGTSSVFPCICFGSYNSLPRSLLP